MTSITPVFLAGGSGTRLWPLSRKSYPKQFVELLSETSLFQSSVKRLQTSEILQFSQPITVTNNEYRFIVSEQINSLRIDPGSILLEPKSRNTAPAILVASIFALERDKEAIIIVSPSDHDIPNHDAFRESIKLGLTYAKAGEFVLFGIQPTSVETGYGYLEIGSEIAPGVTSLCKFIEKPNKELAMEFLEKGGHLWNSGIFLFRAQDMIAAFQKLVPTIYEQVSKAVNNATSDLGFVRLDPIEWEKCANISIDYAIMEKSSNIVVVPFQGKWSDLGDWNSVWNNSQPDELGVAKSENAISIDCNNTLIRSESPSQQIVGLGLDNIIAIGMHDAVLVADKSRVQDVKIIVDVLKENKIAQAEQASKDHRPWGWFESLTLSNRFQVKKIHVYPGASLSLQSHHHRSEHWIVVEGTAKVLIGEQVSLVSEGESVYIPLGTVHRLENPGKLPMVLIEVQTGSYLGEDDIVRHDDQYIGLKAS